jgi:ubiquinone/menaquinone biosynthesis C-methylase UbiE
MNFSDPKTNVLQVGLREGMKVADLGAGSGHYTLAAAAAVGHNGKVFAVDVQEDVLKHLIDSARMLGLRQVEIVWGNVEKKGGTKLQSGAVDVVLCCNVLFQIEHREAFFEELDRILKKGGKVLIIDWAGSYGGVGPSPAHVVDEHAAEKLFIDHGYHKVKNFRAGAHHYGIVCEKP